MLATVEKLLSDFELGELSRRQLTVWLAALASGTHAAQGAKGLRAVSINHVTVKVPDLHRTSGIENFDADYARAKFLKANLKYDGSNSKESFEFFDPDGFQIQLNRPEYVGHVS